MIPTDDDLNRAMAEALGYVKTELTDDGTWWITPHGKKAIDSPWNYCTDRNCLPEIWAFMESKHMMGSYISHLCNMLPKGAFNVEDYVAVHCAKPRLCVIAALQSLGKWPDDWHSPTLP